MIGLLAKYGLDFAIGLIKDNGEDLVKAGIEKVTGIDLNKKTSLTEDEVKAIKDNQLEILNLDFKKLQLELDVKKEANRHDEYYVDKQVEDSTNARDMFKHGSGLQTKVADNIMKQTAWRIPFWIVLNVVLLVGAKKFGLDESIVLAAGNLIGMALKSDYDERANVRNFLFGAMIAKIKKGLK